MYLRFNIKAHTLKICENIISQKNRIEFGVKSREIGIKSRDRTENGKRPKRGDVKTTT